MMIYNMPLSLLVFGVENKDKDAIIIVVIVMNQHNHINIINTTHIRAC